MKAKKEDIGKKAEFRAATRWTGAKQVRIIKDVKLDGLQSFVKNGNEICGG